MADDKWISELRADMPLAEAARIALERRLPIVRERLPAAVFQSTEDPEHVHQLRVSTRRAAAALRIFADCLPARLLKKTKQSLRRIRRSAGEARDWDVFLEMIEARMSRAANTHRPGLIFLAGVAQSRRLAAQEHLIAAHADEAETFSAWIDELLQTLTKAEPGEGTLRSLAHAMLPTLLQEMHTAAQGDLREYEALHQVRILGKQLRYAMELLANCFPPEFREVHYAAVVAMQEILGLANDSWTAWKWLDDLRRQMAGRERRYWKSCAVGIDALARFHEQRLITQRRKFDTWWRGWQKTGAEEAFAEMLRTA